VPAEVLALEDVRFAIAVAAATGCPAKVEPWANDAVPSENGSNTRR
jgi:hypothetical protein